MPGRAGTGKSLRGVTFFTIGIFLPKPILMGPFTLFEKVSGNSLRGVGFWGGHSSPAPWLARTPSDISLGYGARVEGKVQGMKVL